jgi:hypothetical protein
MAQDITVMAFRKRLKGAGYTGISICRRADGKGYQVQAIEPLAGKVIKTKMCLAEMNSLFRK